MTSENSAAVDDFDYDLPDEAIAQHPVEPRDSARLLVAGDGTTPVRHHTVADLDSFVGQGDVVVLNDTRVLAARLLLTKATGGRAEVLLLRPTPTQDRWEALVRPGRRLPPGTVLHLDSEPLVTVGPPVAVDGGAGPDERGDGRRLVDVAPDAVERAGQVPLPPYITAPLADPERYQTVFARQPGSVAAPTAGLHLTDALLDRIRATGATIERVELQVGLGTFRPITADRVADHEMHAERYVVAADVWERIRAARRVVAVGTTVVRTLESAAATGRLDGETSLFIHRGFRWQVVDALLTNFHVPRSSLLVLVDAFVGDRWRSIYDEALVEGYRFLSFGDAMLLERSP
ncbi:MAG: tRNA preQ1(34) S-adenosylmethionine ribosyltransferase-isomerase QueA [Actinomycetota bacterium]